MVDAPVKATNPPQADLNQALVQPRVGGAPSPDANRGGPKPVDQSGIEAATGTNLSSSDAPTDLQPDNDRRRAEAIENRADRNARTGDGDDADGNRAALRDAEEAVYGDDDLKQRGSGSRYQRAHPSARAHLAVVEQQIGLAELASLGRQIVAAAERLVAQNRDVLAATEEAKDAAPPPTG